MNKLFFLMAFFATVGIFSACNTETDDTEINYDYHAHINSPSADDKHVGDSIMILVNFESHSGEIVHNINVRIYNKADGTEIYNKPADAQVNTSAEYDYSDVFVLTEDNGVAAHTDWIIEATVWGEEDGEETEMEIVEFHVHP